MNDFVWRYITTDVAFFIAGAITMRYHKNNPFLGCLGGLCTIRSFQELGADPDNSQSPTDYYDENTSTWKDLPVGWTIQQQSWPANTALPEKVYNFIDDFTSSFFDPQDGEFGKIHLRVPSVEAGKDWAKLFNETGLAPNFLTSVVQLYIEQKCKKFSGTWKFCNIYQEVKPETTTGQTATTIGQPATTTSKPSGIAASASTQATTSQTTSQPAFDIPPASIVPEGSVQKAGLPDKPSSSNFLYILGGAIGIGAAIFFLSKIFKPSKKKTKKSK